MLYFAGLAARNLKRNLIRTAIAIAAVAAVVAIVVFGRGLMVGFTESSFRMYIDNELGHVRLLNQDYAGREILLSLEHTITGPLELDLAEFLLELEELEETRHILPRIRFGAAASVDDDLIRMIGVGVDFERESAQGALIDNIEEGRKPEKNGEIIIGRDLAEKLGAERGSRVTFIFSDAFQSVRARTFEIVGLRRTGASDIDERFFYLSLAEVQRMLDLEGEVTEIMVFAEDAGRAEKLSQSLDSWLAGLELDRYKSVAWNRADPFVEIMLEYDNLMNFVYVLFILMGAVVVITTLFMIIRERKEEIGMMAALGLRERDIMTIFTLEGAFIGLTGSLLGTSLGGFINFYLSRQGLQAEALTDLIDGIDLMMEPIIYTSYNLENLLFSFALGSIITILASLYPAFRAARLDPVEALQRDR
ncbi:putative ABC transport system permease protein [Halarsenatibacter silvermanii]|uniref:Putative ABC transport system permease protein n=2 Tax=Halarsenatibacter silvermanii TaxID=321763 RepID=A0A1G9LU60_9FIRM|nr:putative ABC transport system permease protein [Halarsenatibacter silvermanii]